MKESLEIYYKDWTENQTKLIGEIDSDCGYMINFIVETDNYKGEGPVYLDKDSIETYIIQINNMSQRLEGICRIEDLESDDSYIEFAFKEEKLIVSGLISDYKNKLFFEFDADQTILNPLLTILKRLKGFNF